MMRKILIGISLFLAGLTCKGQDSVKFSIPETRKIAELIVDHKSMKKELQVCDSIIFYQSKVIQSQDSVITLKTDQFQAKLRESEKEFTKRSVRVALIFLGVGLIIGKVL